MLDFLSRVMNKSGDATNTPPPSSGRRAKMDLDEITAVYAEKINEIILNQEFYKITPFIGGDFIIEYTDENSYTCAYKLYFQDKDGTSQEIAAKNNKPMDMSRLSDEAQQELADKKVIKFEIPEPDEEVRKKYRLVKQ